MKYLKYFEENNFCDGCQYFDMDSVMNYPAYKNPLYSLLWKNIIEELDYINPKQYIYKVASNFGGLSYDDALIPVRDFIVDEYIKNMKNGDKFPIGYYTTNSSDQEGRHRAVALLKLGCDKMPIIKKTTNVSNDYKLKIVEEIKDMSRKEVNQYYINKGYRGITDLDWRELQNYLKYQY